MHLDQRTDHLVRPIPKSSELSPFLCHPRVVGPHSETAAAFFAESEGIFLDSAHDLGRYDQRKGRSVCRIPRDVRVDPRREVVGASTRAATVSEREGGRPERGASASLSLGAAQSKRLRQSSTVRTCTPRSRAMSVAGTPSAIINTACARRTSRCSALAGRNASSIRARSSALSASGTVGRPPCARPANAL